MRAKKKMEDLDAKSEEWWEVIKDCFAKELEKGTLGTSWKYSR
jgi:hypothetical protein